MAKITFARIFPSYDRKEDKSKKVIYWCPQLEDDFPATRHKQICDLCRMRLDDPEHKRKPKRVTKL